MANLTRSFTWKKWAPDIGENRELPGGPVLWLELAVGLSGKQLADVSERLSKARDVKYESVGETLEGEELRAAIETARAKYLADIKAVMVGGLGPFVRVFDGPHTVDGSPLATLEDYIGLVQQRADMGVNATSELMEALVAFNSVTGPDELFSRRSSGGARSMDARRTAKAAKKAAGP